MQPKGSPKEPEQPRRQALSLLEQGLRSATVGRAVGMSRASVTRWRLAHEKMGESALGRKPHGGRLARLTPRQGPQPIA